MKRLPDGPSGIHAGRVTCRSLLTGEAGGWAEGNGARLFALDTRPADPETYLESVELPEVFAALSEDTLIGLAMAEGEPKQN